MDNLKKTSLIDEVLSRDCWRIRTRTVMTVLLALVPGICLKYLEAILNGNGSLANFLVVAICVVFFGFYIFIFSKLQQAEMEAIKKANDLAEKYKNELEECQEKRNVLLRENLVMRSVNAGTTALQASSAGTANNIIHDIVERAEIHLPKQFFENSCQRACEKIHQALVNTYERSEHSYEVSYVKLDESCASDTQIVLIAFENEGHRNPTIYNRMRNSKSRKWYYDYGLFVHGKDDIVALFNEDEINYEFSLTSQNQGKYKQYFAVPVVCPTKGGGKMIGLLQVVIMNKPICQSREELLRLAACLLAPYGDTLLLIHKLIKGLSAKPKLALME